MIKSLSLKFFRSHRNTILDLSPHINAIIGRSRAGKTNVLRGLLWLRDNRPLGERFKSRFAGKKDKVEVGLTVINDDANIEIARGEREYRTSILPDPLSGFGKSVPQTVSDTLNLGEINIQKQFDQPFLVTSSPGEVARIINRITRTEKADEWISNLTTKINKAEANRKLLEKKEEEETKRLEDYGFLEDLTVKVQELEELDIESKRIENESRQLDLLIQEIQILGEGIEETKGWLDCEEMIKGIERLMFESQDIELWKSKLSKYINLSIEIGKVKEYLKIERNIKELESLLEQSNLTEKQLSSLSQIIDKTEFSRKQAERLSISIKELMSDYESELRRLKVCPICYSEIDENHIKMIIEEAK